MNAPVSIRLFGAVPDSIVDGPRLRYAVFVQGCAHACPGCHNPESHDFCGGTLTDIDAVFDDIRANKLVHDVTFSGGDPFEQAAACAELGARLKQCGYGIWTYTGYLYEDLLRVAQGPEGEYASCGTDEPAGGQGGAPAGSCLGEAAEPADSAAPAVVSDPVRSGSSPAHLDPHGVRDLLACTDVLVDGPFVQSLKSLSLKWRGSSNQRIIDLRATREAGRIIQWENDEFVFEKPASW